MQVKSGSIFDNILVTDDEKYAEEFGQETWGEMKDLEKAMKEAYDEEQKRKAEELRKKEEEEEGKSCTVFNTNLMSRLNFFR